LKYLIAGLGNIGAEYTNTRHNIGFKILDAFSEASNFSFKSDRYADSASYKYKGRILVLIKPSTYMNLSGKAINYWLQKEGIEKENMLVLVDDVALPFGEIRIRAKGSDGGHNGLSHIQEILNTTAYPRMRFGIGNDYGFGQQVDYVLGKWDAEQKAKLPERIQMSIEVIKSFTTIGLERTMNFFNGK